MSVAGKQKGIHEGQRSNLFFEAIRIIKEMRKADESRGRTGKHIRPRFAVWENVPGAFSSNKGEDFRAVLEAFASVRENDISIPRPKKWQSGGGMAGHGWSLAWKVYDAQYWGVPQRRKRIYLVADFGSERAGEILFERESVRGDSSAGTEAREGTAADAEGGAGGSSGAGIGAFMGGQGAKARSIGYCDDGTTPTLKAAPSGGNTVPDVCYPINTMVATRGGKDDMRTCFGIGEPGDPQFTISAAHEHGVCYALQGNGIDRADTAGCNGEGWRENEMYTLNTIDRPAVCVLNDQGGTVMDVSDKAMTLRAQEHGHQPIACYRSGGFGDMPEGVGTLRANGGDVGGY